MQMVLDYVEELPVKILPPKVGRDHTIPTECDLFSDSWLGIIWYLSGSVEIWGAG